MERPDKVYLPNPIMLAGDIRVSHTAQGCQYKIEHYKHILATATKKQLTDADRQHVQKTIENFAQHLQLLQNNIT